MKAIIKVTNKSSYAHLNGLTFEVSDILSKVVSLDINGTKTDFGFTEVVIVDLQNEYQRAYNEKNWSGAHSECLHIGNYCYANGIRWTPSYECPA